MKKNKKIIIIVLILCLLAALLVGGIVFLTGNSEEPAPAPMANWDIDWYNADEKEFLITTVEELYGLAELSKTYDFKGQTIKLGADIVINDGNADKWGDKVPEYLWNPITGFAGTFDGQDHTISGVYGNSIVTSLGLFTDTQKGCVIKNLKLVNSYFKNNNDLGTGSIIGIGGGTLENIYSDAVIVSAGNNIGGLIGCVKTKGENQITNCWFDGTITMDGYDCSGVGGLVGAYTVEDAINTIAHCLSTADINCLGENVGGVCGYVGNGSFLNLNDSMFTGTLVYDTNKYAVVGSAVGQVMGSASIIVNDTYTVDEIANRTIGTSGGYQKGNTIALNKNYLLGKAGYQWTTLDFENYWVAQKDGMPRLGYFTKATESIDGVEKMVDISWYDPAGATFEISNVQQLYGFAYLSRSYDFRGQTMKLVADITVNEGDASKWGENAPAYSWTPIAWYGSSLSQRFKGTFDGQGHTISGIYAKGTENITCVGLFGEVYHGAVVKDFKLVNSYFEGVLDSSVRGPVGSVAGRLRGTIENVYSDAIVVNSSKNTGGIVGMITGSGQNKISGCWFDGKLTGITRSGGILGGVYGNKGNIEATIEHCLNTGEMNIQIGQAGVGGICGTVETWSILYVDDCLNAGTYQTFGTGATESKHIGTLVGTVTMTDSIGSKVVVTDSYGVKEFYSRLVGWKHGDEGIEWNSMMYVTSDELVGYGGYKWTSLDFENHWSVRSNACPVPVAFAQNTLSTSGVVRMVDYSWYNPDAKVHTIKNFQQLYGMARLWEVTNLFKGHTILLGADITINKGNAYDWAETAPAYVWEPVKFNGTFNGQGHAISGVYVKGGEEDNYIGFFHRIYKNGTVKNLKITNSYFEGTMTSFDRGAVGSIAGRSNGIIDTVYSDAIVVNSARMTGGLVGMITGEGENVIRNSWFDGQITAINRTGGILGGMYGNKTDIEVTIENCTNTGDISVQIGNGDVGGICGIAETGGTLTISDCLNAGTYKTVGSDKEANTHIGTVFGSVTEKDGVASHVVLDNVYGVSDFYSKLVGWKYGAEGVSSSAAVLLDMETLTAEGGYRYAQLNYTNEFALNQDGIPVPKAFGVKTVTASDLLDYSWFDSSKSEYTLTTAAQLEAFNVLCNGENNYFSGKTVKLGADITLNEGEAADWAATAPEKVWTPIAFNGTFDGQGHTISGVYVKGAQEDNYVGFFRIIYKNGTVKNLKITNSYFEGTMTSSDRGAVGSIAGRSNGIIDTVYSDAIVVNSARMTGGLVGMITGEGENVIRNSWFDGQISAINRTGGILGGMYGNKTDIEVTIENCTNTGDISVQIGQGDVGGICGIAETGGKLTIADCLNAGTYKTVGSDKEANTHIGTVFGSVTEKDGVASHVVLDNVYGVSDFYSKLVGWKYGAEGVSSSAAVLLDMETLTAEGGYHYAQLDYTNEFALNQDGIPVPKAFGVKTVTASDLLDYSWFDSSKSEYTLTTAAQLEAFNVLCNGQNDYFSGKTVKLGADITLTGGSETAPNWTPITFSGVFDGQGHTVSGVYVKSEAQYNGFFNTVNSGAVVKNLKLENSYIEGAYTGTESRAGVGSIVGRNRGTVDTVYSNAIVVNSKAMTGGIAGMSEGGTITNCWFDGTVYGARATGGILGGAYAKAATIENCLNTGKVSVTDNSYYVGGICGELQNASTATIADCLNAGTLEGTTAKSGTIVGRVDTKAALTVTNGYGTREFLETAIGDCTGTLNSSSYAVKAVEDIRGYGAYQWTRLDFETKPYWVLKKDGIPVLAVFDTTDLSLEEAKKLPNYSWYDENATEYVISTAQQLLAFNDLCDEDTDYFNGKTVKLGVDITLTGGSETAPNWTPVRLKGTFDGQGYTISGVYIKTTEKVYTGFFDRIDANGTVKNLRLEDSYIEGNGTNARSGVGSIAGRNYGTIDTVYSNATLKNSMKMTGGIVGMSFGGTVTNCWFDGQINAIGSTGGIIGGAYGQAATIAHCLNTGTIIVGNDSEYVGGLYGYAEKASTLTISDSLHAGTILKSADSDTVKHVGVIIGGVDTDATLTMNDVYGAKAAATTDAKVLTGDAIGALNGEMTNSSNYAARALADIQGYGAYQWTSLDFETKPYWVLKKDGIPVLAAFDTTDLSLEEAKKLPNYSWYDENATEYVISTVQQLLAFNDLCNADTDYFKGKTVKLGADITLTGGSETQANWTPIKFKGTFDGQGHTVSGVYVTETGENIGFFSYIYSGAVVKELSLKDSYIEHYGDAENNRAAVGSIAGKNHGTIEKVYSNAVVKNNKLMTGGIVGMSSETGENKISNCWFDGQIIATGSTGGILGGTYAATATVEHCLNTGSISIETSGANLTAIGGLCGYSQSTGGVTISDSLNAGTVTLNAKDGNTIKQVGTIIGAIHAKATATKINDAYGVKEFSASVIGYGAAAAGSADYAAVGKDTIKGSDAYHAMTLDFEVKPYWVLMDGDIPGLAAFGEGTLAVADAKSQPDTSWYDASADTYVINDTAQIRGYAKLLADGVDFSQKTIVLGADTYELGSGEQLRAFAVVCEKNNFAGKTVNLTANINLGGAENPWTPVSFGGTFDGQGYTISGVYAVGEDAGLFSILTSGATVKNLMIVDSYFEGTQNAGGIAAVSDGGKISNCQFAGTVTGVTAGGIVGEAKNGAIVEYCLNTGSVTATANAGGLIGSVQTAILSDSLNAGVLSGTATNMGSIVGSNAGTLTVEDVYGIKEFTANAIGSGTATGTYAVKNLADIKGYSAYQWTTLDFDGGSWVLKDGAIPALNVFDDTNLDLAYAKTLPDYTWYSETAESYVLTTARQLHGYVLLKDTITEKSVTLGASEYALATADQLLAFNALSADVDYFAGKTVKLSNNIALTGGSATTPNWTPVSIKGTFNGQGYSISGAYVSAGSTYVGFFHTVYSGATVTNLKLIDSVIKNTNTSGNCGTGSIAGRCLGTVDTVYSNATVTNGAAMTGGIVGMVVAIDGVTDGAKKITNCWFDGVINGNNATGGILGGSYGMAATIEHCLNTGTMNIGASKKQIGGLVGYVQGASSVTVSDSLNAGSLVTTSTSQIGTIVGAAAKNALTVSNVYGATDTGFGTMKYGWTGSTPVVVENTDEVVGELESFFGIGAAKLDFTTWWTARDGMIPMLKSFS